jgi:hypothetical protein
MQHILRAAFAAVLAMAIGHFATVAASADPSIKQIKLTEKHILSFIAAQKDMSPILEKIGGDAPDPLPAPIQAELDTAAKKHGFKDFSEYDDVVSNITLVMSLIDPTTKVFTDPITAIKQEIATVTADKTIPEKDKKVILEELNEALKTAQPLEFPSNVELVKKYYDKIDASLS